MTLKKDHIFHWLLSRAINLKKRTPSYILRRVHCKHQMYSVSVHCPSLDAMCHKNQVKPSICCQKFATH